MQERPQVEPYLFDDFYQKPSFLRTDICYLSLKIEKLI